MAERDRIERLEYQLATVARQIAGMPVRIARSGGTDKFRLIRGQSYGVQSGTNILLDNIVELSGGLDPSHGAPAAQVSVYNLFGATFADNEWVDAVYSPGATGSSDWETLKSSTGTERYRLIQGKCVGAVAADAAAFSIDTIVPLAGGLDPRTVPGDMSETLSIANAQAETFVDNEDVIAVYFDLGGGVTGWSTLITERFRAIRGTWYSGSGTLQIKSVVPLGNGLDPRTDPTDGDEIVEVINTPGDTYSSGDKVYADWDATSEVWEARPKSSGGTSGALRWGIINSAGSASSTAGTPSTDGTIDLFAAFGGDTGVSFNNYYPDEAPSGAVGCIDASSNIVTWSCGTF